MNTYKYQCLISHVLYHVTIKEFLRSNALQKYVLRFFITVLLHDVINSTNLCMLGYIIRFNASFLICSYIGH